jgi:RimJ/RimL family protein N-acetyltransferase
LLVRGFRPDDWRDLHEYPPSWKLLERLSLRREGDFRGFAFFRRDEGGEPLWHDAYQYALLAEEWRALG